MPRLPKPSAPLNLHEPKPALRCCVPTWRPAPSGWHWFHQRSCPIGRGQKVGNEPGRQFTRAVNDHPARGESRLRAALDHPVGCRCEDCAYLFAHIDDDDDWRDPRGLE